MVKEEDISSYILQLKKEFPKLQIQEKKSAVMKFFFSLPIIKRFRLQEYTQAINNTIWLSCNWSKLTSFKKLSILKHEREHLLQFQKYGPILMSILYLFIFFPIGLAYFRAKFERQGLIRNMEMYVEHFGNNSKTMNICRDKYMRVLCGPSYLYAWPFKKAVTKWFLEDWNLVSSSH
jgi:hypothetical protein